MQTAREGCFYLFKIIITIYMSKLIKYIKGSIEEMKKVTWPSKQETKNYTLLVVGISLAVAVFLGAVDYIFSWGFKFIIS